MFVRIRLHWCRAQHNLVPDFLRPFAQVLEQLHLQITHNFLFAICIVTFCAPRRWRHLIKLQHFILQFIPPGDGLEIRSSRENEFALLMSVLATCESWWKENQVYFADSTWIVMYLTCVNRQLLAPLTCGVGALRLCCVWVGTPNTGSLTLCRSTLPWLSRLGVPTPLPHGSYVSFSCGNKSFIWKAWKLNVQLYHEWRSRRALVNYIRKCFFL